MPRQAIEFEIEDSHTVDQVLVTFAEVLERADRPLADILSRVLSDLSQDTAVDRERLLDALYAATAPDSVGAPDASAAEAR